MAGDTGVCTECGQPAKNIRASVCHNIYCQRAKNNRYAAKVRQKRAKNKQRPPTGVCTECGQPARTPNSQVCNNPECRRKKKALYARRTYRNRYKVPRVCRHCGKVITDGKLYGRRVCSAECHAAIFVPKKREHRERERLIFKKEVLPMVTCRCPKCGKTHEREMRWIGRGVPRIYCWSCVRREDVRFSRECISAVF